MGIWNSAIVLQGALGDGSVHFDPRKTNWIGAPAVGLPTCSMMGFSGIHSLEDLLNTNKRIKLGATRGGTLNDLPKILNKTLGTQLEIIPGYRGTGPIRTAMQKREVDGACWGWESQRVTARAMLDAEEDDKLIPILTHGNLEDPELKGLPRLTEVVKGERNLEIVNSWLQVYNFQKPFSLPPETPRERINILRNAFENTLGDERFLAEAKASKLLITKVTGEQVEGYVNTILKMSPETKESLQFLVIQKKRN